VNTRSREVKGTSVERKATVNRREGVRSRYKRCSRCKKLRMYVPYANHHASCAWEEGKAFTDWKKLEDGTQVCFICVERLGL